MRHAKVYVFGLVILGITAFGAGLAGAVLGVGSYYATPSWDMTVPANSRFIVLINMNSQAVLDRETGLVWEQSPSAVLIHNWEDAQLLCNSLTKGGRLGWRLPTLQELASLVDPRVLSSGLSGLALPTGSPFSNVQASTYWSATTFAGDTDFAWGVDFGLGTVGPTAKPVSTFVWCVRGGQGVDPQ